MCIKVRFQVSTIRTFPIAIITVTLMLLFCSCAKQISHEELCKIEKENMGNTFPTLIWYMGSKDGYDHFKTGFYQSSNSLSLGYRGTYKVLSENTNLVERFKLTTDKSMWKKYDCWDLQL